MSGLQLFLLIDMFVLGIVATIAAQHAYSHWLHKRHPEKDHAALKDSPLPQATKDRLLKEAQSQFEAALTQSSDSMQHDLKATVDRVNLHLEELGNDLVHKELTRYQQHLDGLHQTTETTIAATTSDIDTFIADRKQALEAVGGQIEEMLTASTEEITSYKQALKDKLDGLYAQAETAIGGVDAEITAHTATLKEQLAQDIETQKQQLISQFESRLGDIVTAFLMETLQHNVDLGSQADYLVAMLNEHKDELLKQVRS